MIMTSFGKILQDIQSREDEANYISVLNGCKLLIIDDLGAERNTDYALEKVYNVIDSRARGRQAMILTTNLSFDEMMRNPDIRYRRIYDRIFETCIRWRCLEILSDYEGGTETETVRALLRQ